MRAVTNYKHYTTCIWQYRYGSANCTSGGEFFEEMRNYQFFTSASPHGGLPITNIERAKNVEIIGEKVNMRKVHICTCAQQNFRLRNYSIKSTGLAEI
jgi:hypothetical protein